MVFGGCVALNIFCFFFLSLLCS
jgi:hypothetical protein